jgi:hypothetical protein
VQQVIVYADQHPLFDQMLDQVATVNPRKYRELAGQLKRSGPP